MIAKMQKLQLAAMLSDKDRILDALQKTRAAEVKKQVEEEGTAIPVKDDAALLLRAADTESALRLLTKAAEDYARDHGVKVDYLKDGFDVSYSCFMGMKEKGGEADEMIAKAKSLSEEKAALTAEGYALAREEKALTPYASVDLPFAELENGRRAGFLLGVIPAAKEEDFIAALGGEECAGAAAEKLCKCEAGGVYALAYLKDEKDKLDNLLGASGFSAYPYEYGENGFVSAKARFESVAAAIAKNGAAQEKNAAEFYELSKKLPFLKTYSDYLSYLLEKENVSDDLRATERVFLLEAYVPEERADEVKLALESTTGACYYEFAEPAEEENPPTLLKNNKAVRNFEDITNMYSVPSSREFDPNTVMGFFYSLFMGFIMGDIGYGLIMMLGGGLIWWKNRARESGFKRLSAVFAMGGVFSVIWGVLFNSLLGLQVLPFTVMPDMQKDMWNLAGISVPSVLVISMEIGIVQIFAGYICRAVQCWRRGETLAGIYDGVVWAFFSLGAFLAVIGFVEESNLPVFKSVGGITAGVSLAIAMLTAGHGQKFFARFTKGFGAAYGVINYASDVLSYARLYGLLLSGAVIANIVSTYAMAFITGGNAVVAILGVALMVAGHAFNLAMSLLGAYIHDARLQYVEFFGKFYEGEGELFTPLGSSQKYVYLLPAEAAA